MASKSNVKLDGLCVVIPALNEVETIRNVISGCLEIAERVLIVDDGSTDGTGEAAKQAGADVLRHEQSHGYDASVADGLNEAFRTGATAVVTCDADGQHRLPDVRKVAEPVISGEVQYCAGIRDHYNRPAEAVVGVFSRLLFETPDPFCGLKCYHRSLYEQCGKFPVQMNIGTTPLIWVSRKRLKKKFVPIQVEKRKDHPRFGTFIRSNIKLTVAFAKTAADYGLSSFNRL